MSPAIVVVTINNFRGPSSYHTMCICGRSIIVGALMLPSTQLRDASERQKPAHSTLALATQTWEPQKGKSMCLEFSRTQALYIYIYYIIYIYSYLYKYIQIQNQIPENWVDESPINSLSI